jgi:hypothetical protein
MGLSVASPRIFLKRGECGVFWASFARPKYPTPRFIEKKERYNLKWVYNHPRQPKAGIFMDGEV